ncbi:hypothetical protein ABMY20_15430 [Tenacibaculum sp. SSH1-16]|uniref:hypothetical protein n=1 Tax=Tenacibaculum sp. SSH1-16 TaxID=3136667 RepID=UPI0032C3F77A
MWLLKLLNFKDLKYLIIIALFGFGTYLYQQNKELKKENQRTVNNYQTALKLDSLEIAIFKVKKDKEIKELLQQNKELNSLVKKSKVKTKRIQGLYYQKISYIDSLKKTINVTPIIKYIRDSTPYTIPWRDSTTCLDIRGKLVYRNDSLNVIINKREFNNETVLIKHEGRRKKVKWLLGLRLGPRDITFTPESKCGKNKVIIIDKDK